MVYIFTSIDNADSAFINRPRLFPLYGDYTITWEQRTKQNNGSLYSIWSERGLGPVFKYMDMFHLWAIRSKPSTWKSILKLNNLWRKHKENLILHSADFLHIISLTLIKHVTKYYREEKHQFAKETESDTDKI